MYIFSEKGITTYSQLSRVWDGNTTIPSSTPSWTAAGSSHGKSKSHIHGLYLKKLPSNHLKASIYPEEPQRAI